MSYAPMAGWVMLAGLLFVMPLSGGTPGDQPRKPSTQEVGTSGKDVALGSGLPVYRPPQRGTPALRMRGGSRGEGCSLGGKGELSLSVLAPDHLGLTVQEQPSLYWFLSTATACPIEVTLIDEQTIHPLLETRLTIPIQAGVQRFQLADHGIRLSIGMSYRWYVAVVVDPDNRSKDIIAGGTIERVPLPEALRTKLAGVGQAHVPFVYAEAGLWYDALAAISDLIDAQPTEPALRQQRAALLEQVALPDIATEDRRYGHAR